MSDAPDTPTSAPTPEPEPTKPKVRLLDVTVEPRFALDGGEHLRPLHRDDLAQLGILIVATIPSSEWPTYSSERFPREVREWQERIDNNPSLLAAMMGEPPPPLPADRAERRPKRRAAARRRGNSLGSPSWSSPTAQSD
jgi:hypothetical protein